MTKSACRAEKTSRLFANGRSSLRTACPKTLQTSRMQSHDSVQSQMANYDCPKADVSGQIVSGRITGADFSYGVGQDMDEADSRLLSHKSAARSSTKLVLRPALLILIKLHRLYRAAEMSKLAIGIFTRCLENSALSNTSPAPMLSLRIQRLSLTATRGTCRGDH